MTKCLFKALKAVDLEKHIGLFRSLGYESAGALAHFRAEHFEKLNFNEHDLLHLISLLDVLKEATRDGKICPHYFTSNKTTKQQSTMKSAPIRATWNDDKVPERNYSSTINNTKQSIANFKPKRSNSSIGMTGRSSSTLVANENNNSNDFILQRSSTVLSRQHHHTQIKNTNQRFLGPKTFLNRPAVQHIKVKSYNYGVPAPRRPRNISNRNVYRHNSHVQYGSIFAPNSYHGNDMISHSKPAEIYVYARKRPLLSSENNMKDTITVPDNKRIIITENKANLDCTPLLRKTEFEFDQVFGSDAPNKQVFESTVLPFLSTSQRHNLTYICFGQTGSGKSHTIFGSKSSDGLLVYCTQLLLHEIDLETDLVCSFYEIYNNQVYDLINSGKKLFVREDGEHHVNVIGKSELILKSLDNLRSVIDDGLGRRHHGKSAFNSNSSRSHAVFQIALKNHYDSSEIFRLVFIDLAGSERATDAQNNQRQTRREGAQINWSLLALKECIRSLDLTHSHAPFRQSKLTHILRDSLIGLKTRTCLMGNVSPADDCCQCSLNTLQYASRIRDISIRHRHRSLSMMINPTNHLNEDLIEREINHVKPQRTFKPATASTPVHRLISSLDQHVLLGENQTEMNTGTRLTKTIDIDWEIADDDLPISGNGNNHQLKSLIQSSRDLLAKSNLNNHQHVNHYKKNLTNEIEENLSSYFPQPQADIKKPTLNKKDFMKQPYKSSRLMYDTGNERQWETVPVSKRNHHQDPSVRQTNSARIIPPVPIPTPDENRHSSGTIAESLGTKITKFTENDRRHQIENLDFNKQYDTGVVTSDTELMIDSDRPLTRQDPLEFSSNRDELLLLLSNRLKTNTQRSSSITTPRKEKLSSKHSNSSSNISKTKTVLSSPSKNRQQNRFLKSASSTTSLTSVNQDKRPSIKNKKSNVKSIINFEKFDPNSRRTSNHRQQQRTVPLRVHHSSDSEDYEKHRQKNHRRKLLPSKTTITRKEPTQTVNNVHLLKNEREQTNLPNKYSEPIVSSTSSAIIMQNNAVEIPIDTIKYQYNQSFDYPISPMASTNINNSPPISTFHNSPSKDFGVRVTDQLNALRSLLESRMAEHDEIKYSTNSPPIARSSSNSWNHDIFQAYPQTFYKTNLNRFENDIDDDTDQEVARNFNNNNNNKNEKSPDYHIDMFSTSTTSSNQNGNLIDQINYDKTKQTSLSSFTNELNQAKVSLSATISSTSTIASNLAAKIDTNEQRICSIQDQDVHSHSSMNDNHQLIGTNKNLDGIMHPASDSDHTSHVNLASLNQFNGTSSEGSSTNHSQTRSPVFIPPFSTLNIVPNTTNIIDHLLDSGQGSSPLTGSSFDALLSSLKNMREKSLDFAVRINDDKLIPVAE